MKAKEASSFFEKKEAKKLLPTGARVCPTPAPRDKSFLVLFFKKEPLASF
jgi:hypothetical protein